MDSDEARGGMRVRREPPAFRRAIVRATADRSPRMRRVVLAGPELIGFTVDGPASSVRLLLPGTDGTLVLPTWAGNEFVKPSGERAVIRTLTPLLVDRERGELAVDVVLHGDSAATRWARGARVGDEVAVSGPGRVDPINFGAKSYLLGGDESALPAIGQLLQALAPATTIDVQIEISQPDARLDLPAHPGARVTWLDADPGLPPGHTLAGSIEAIDELPRGVWLAGEAAAIQRLRRHLFEVRGTARGSVVARGYWKHAR